MAITNLKQLYALCAPTPAGDDGEGEGPSALQPPTPGPLGEALMRQYLCSAGLEFSFTGCSSYFALAKRTLQGADRAGHFRGLDPAEREALLTEPDGLLVRDISGLLKNTTQFPSAWRFVQRDWSFSKNFRTRIAEVLDPAGAISGPDFQILLAQAAGVDIPLGTRLVPLEYRRER